jgi:hypothetical protein
MPDSGLFSAVHRRRFGTKNPVYAQIQARKVKARLRMLQHTQHVSGNVGRISLSWVFQGALLRLEETLFKDRLGSLRGRRLEHLHARVSPGGILIMDDCGHWRSTRKAADEYIEKYALTVFLNRIITPAGLL